MKVNRFFAYSLCSNELEYNIYLVNTSSFPLNKEKLESSLGKNEVYSFSNDSMNSELCSYSLYGNELDKNNDLFCINKLYKYIEKLESSLGKMNLFM